MRFRLMLLAAFIAVVDCRAATQRVDPVAIVEYAKQIDVKELDSSLASNPLDAWLRQGPARLETIVYRVSDCDIKRHGKEPDEGWPLCVKVNFQRDGLVSGWGIFTVGTRRKGISGSSRFEYASAHVVGKTRPGLNVHRLSELPGMLDQLTSTGKE